MHGSGSGMKGKGEEMHWKAGKEGTKKRWKEGGTVRKNEDRKVKKTAKEDNLKGIKTGSNEK